jgi:putative alpha-1,2-mannosidase
MKRFFALLLTAHCLLLAALAQQDFARYVNPFIGTGGHGHTFPGATMPFGMVQLSPDTRIDNWDGSSGYHYSDDIIYGFSHTHLSGTGIPDGCDILLMPTIGDDKLFAMPTKNMADGYVSKFSHANEKAEPGYYSVKLDATGIAVELTATQRVGFHRYSFPNAGKVNVILDLGWRDKILSSQLLIRGDRVEGFRHSASWAKDQKVYFVAKFSKPVDNVLSNASPSDTRTEKFGIINNFPFTIKDGEPILVKVAISYVSIEGARKNLEAELPGWDFDKVRADARAAWNRELSKIEVSGGTQEQTTNFYTALYHTMIQPNVFNDVDGRYKGHDGKVHSLWSGGAEEKRSGGVGETRGGGVIPKSKIENPKSSSPAPAPAPMPPPAPAPASEQSREPNTRAMRTTPGLASIEANPKSAEQYTVFSLWDTFRAAHPLYTIIDQKRTVDFINTFIRQYDQGGRLPVWELWGEETDTMIGYHGVSVIADAMAKGIKGFDYEKAYTASKHSANLDHFGLAAYKKRGYISGEDENESVSKTMEYAYNDYCIATMAQVLIAENLKDTTKAGRARHDALEKEAAHYFSRSLYYRNLYDAKTGFMRPKRNGAFITPFAPNEITFHFTEGNSWQYSFFAPHDVSALAELHGGKINFAKKLDELFTTEQKLAGREQPDVTGLIGQYAHGNEPSHHMAYLYNYANQPWKTQSYVHRILNEFYKNAPDGLIGNEDCGQMSAWYILSALGFYQVNPSRAVYDLGTPLFKTAKINLENGKFITINAANVSEKNIYVRSVKLNGQPFRKTQFRHSDLMNGGTLEFEMSDTPVTDWFTEFSYSAVGGSFVQVPIIDGDRTFRDTTKVEIRPATEGGRILYSTDGSAPTTEYKGPFTINKTTAIKAIAVDERGRRSFVVDATMAKRPNDWTVKLASSYNMQYPGGSDDAIIDGLRGNVNFAAGEWQGYQGKTFEAMIDLQRVTEIKNVGGSFLQSARSWIWMPDRLEFQVSDNSTDFRTVAEIKNDVPQTLMEPTIKEFRRAITPTRARYVRVRAYNFGNIPAWHLGAGGDPWIFVDEIFIK